MLTDHELLERYRTTNDPVAFAELSRRYRDMVFASAKRITGDRHDAEDVSQSCFLELARRAWNVKTSVAAYLHWAATYRARNVIRDRARRRKYEQTAAVDRAQQTAQTEEKQKTWEFVAPEVDAAIARLPEDLRVPVILFYLRGLSDREIAAELAISHRTVERRLQVGVRRLRANLTKSGFGLPVAVLTLGLKAGRAQAAPASLTATVGRMALAGMGKRAPVHSAPRKNPRWVPRALSTPIGVAAAACVSIGGTAALIYLSRPSQPSPYDRLRDVYQPYLSETFPQRIAAMCEDQETFWRGAQPLFFDWCRQNAADLLADHGGEVLSPAVPLLEDARTLPIEIDSANTTRLPFEIELLQALVAVRLERNLMNDPARFSIDRETINDYERAMAGHDRWPTLGGPSAVSEAELQRYMNPRGTLRRIVYSPKGKTAEIIEPLQNLGAIRSAIDEGLRNNPRLLDLFPTKDRDWVLSHVVAAGRRQRIKSVASQGLNSVIVLVRADATASIADVLLEMHEMAPSAAELSHAIEFDPRPPGRRAAEDARRIAPDSPPISWCVLDSSSMLIRRHEMPLELDSDHRQTAQADWATAVGASHRGNGNEAAILAALTPRLISDLSARADACAVYIQQQCDLLQGDPRSAIDRKTTELKIVKALQAESTERQ